ncbi:MAG: hypothetical protein ACR2N5_01080 [Solirubrobacterales bacterium]
MFTHIRKRLTFANTVSVIALMFALGGGAYAMSVPNNSVTSPSVKDKALKGKDLAPDAIKSGRINNGTIQSRDIGKDEVKGKDIKSGAVKSSEIRNGEVRAADLGEIVERSVSIEIENGEMESGQVQCNEGEQVTGGGADWDQPSENAPLLESHRVDNGWKATAEHNAGNGSKNLKITALCLVS